MKNKFLYKNFLERNHIYSLAKNWWKREFKKQIIGKKTSSGKKINSAYTFNWHNENGYKDGNPIFTVFSVSKQKLVRIIQKKVENEDNQDFIEISAWLQKGFYSNKEYEEEIPELVISLELSRNSSKIAFDWIKRWFDDQLTDEDLERDFDERKSVSA